MSLRFSDLEWKGSADAQLASKSGPNWTPTGGCLQTPFFSALDLVPPDPSFSVCEMRSVIVTCCTRIH